MGWKFWEREQTEAERSLAALQEQAAARTAATPPAPQDAAVAEPAEPRPEAPLTPREAEGMAHMNQVMGELEQALAQAVPEEEIARFSLHVTAVRAGTDGAVVLTGGPGEGAVEPGDLVGLVVLPHGMAETDPALPAAEQAEQTATAWLGTRTRTATVVSWRADGPDGPELTLAGLGPEDVSVGSMVMR